MLQTPTRLTTTILGTLIFGLATALTAMGAGPFADWQEHAMIPGFFALVFLGLSFYYLSENKQGQNVLLMTVILALIMSIPVALGVLMMQPS